MDVICLGGCVAQLTWWKVHDNKIKFSRFSNMDMVFKEDVIA